MRIGKKHDPHTSAADDRQDRAAAATAGWRSLFCPVRIHRIRVLASLDP